MAKSKSKSKRRDSDQLTPEIYRSVGDNACTEAVSPAQNRNAFDVTPSFGWQFSEAEVSVSDTSLTKDSCSSAQIWLPPTAMNSSSIVAGDLVGIACSRGTADNYESCSSVGSEGCILVVATAWPSSRLPKTGARLSWQLSDSLGRPQLGGRLHVHPLSLLSDSTSTVPDGNKNSASKLQTPLPSQANSRTSDFETKATARVHDCTSLNLAWHPPHFPQPSLFPTRLDPTPVRQTARVSSSLTSPLPSLPRSFSSNSGSPFTPQARQSCVSAQPESPATSTTNSPPPSTPDVSNRMSGKKIHSPNVSPSPGQRILRENNTEVEKRGSLGLPGSIASWDAVQRLLGNGGEKQSVLIEQFAVRWLESRLLMKGNNVIIPLCGQDCIFEVIKIEGSSGANSSSMNFPSLDYKQQGAAQLKRDVRRETFEASDLADFRASRRKGKKNVDGETIEGRNVTSGEHRLGSDVVPLVLHRVTHSTQISLEIFEQSATSEISQMLEPESGKAYTQNGTDMEEDIGSTAVAAARRGADSESIHYSALGGLGEQIAALRELVELPLTNPELFARYGLKPPRGVLLYGPPGTGKTSLARSVASQTGASLFVINGPEVVSEFFGESEQALKAVFKAAQKAAPSVVFIDELDAIAPSRGGDAEDLAQRMVAALLTIMDGGDPGMDRVIVIAATNRVDSIDPALRRPGRFDRELEIGVPTPAGRLEILQAMIAKMHNSLTPPDIQQLAAATHGFVGADLAALCSEAGMAALRRQIHDLNSRSERGVTGVFSGGEGAAQSSSKQLEASQLRHVNNIVNEQSLCKDAEDKSQGSIVCSINQSNVRPAGFDGAHESRAGQYERGAPADSLKVSERSKILQVSGAGGSSLEPRRGEENTCADGLGECSSLWNDGQVGKEETMETGHSLADLAATGVGNTNHDRNGISELASTPESYEICGDQVATAKNQFEDLSEAEQTAEAPPLASLRVELLDFEEAKTKIRPSALREVSLEVPKVLWSDIGGNDDIKQRLQEAVEWPQKHAEAFARVGAKPPRGLLLYGPPGCSKTLLARAVATEASLNFLAVKGPEIFSKFVGESEKAVNVLFARARTSAPSIIFFDEIDGLAATRGDGGEDGGTGVGDRVMSQLLIEMDGLAPMSGVAVIAATNRPDLIDPALLRPGRFDRLLYVGPPKEAARAQIFSIHLRKTPCSPDVDSERLAKMTPGYTGADIASVCREAAMAALEENFCAEQVCMRHFILALQTVSPSRAGNSEAFYASFLRGAQVSPQSRMEHLVTP